MQGCCFLSRGLTNFYGAPSGSDRSHAMGASSAVPQERLLQCHLSWDVSGCAFLVTDTECADMCCEIFLGLMTGEGKEGRR